MADRVLVLGTGLVGGSIGMALRTIAGAHVAGYDRSPDAAARALEVGALDEVATDPQHAVARADVLVVAVPVGQIVPALRELSAALPGSAVVTDVGSTKGPIVAEAERCVGGRFVGGHPMAGTEGEGIEAARADLFDGALWILTPTEQTDADAYRQVHGLVQRIGARTLALEPGQHDRLVALVSHLPYAVATTLMNLADDEGDERVFRAAAGGFRDVTRTAGSNPDVWRDILSANRDALLEELDAFSGRLASFRDALADRRWDDVDALIASARAARQRFPLKGERGPTRPVTVEVPVPDRAGVLAEITTTLGEGGINIEDLWMTHTTAGGVVRIVVDGADVARRAADGLTARGYHPRIVEEQGS